MRNSSSFWDETPRHGDLVWCKASGARYKLGIVIDIRGFNYWEPEKTFPKWKYMVWLEGNLILFPSWKVTKV